MNQVEVLRFLAEAELIGSAQLVQCDFALLDRSRRNRNYAATWDGGRQGYFVKCARDADHAATISNEASFLHAANTRPGGTGWCASLPQYVKFCIATSTLVIRFETDRITLRALLEERQRVFMRPAGLVGRFVGQLHAVDPRSVGLDRLAGSAERAVFGMTFDHPDHAVLQGSTGGAIAVLKAVQSSPALVAYYPEIRTQWRKESIVHCDLRWDNLLLARRTGCRTPLVVIDWELVTLGDPAWDLATIWAEHLGCWLQSIPLAAERDDELHVSLARFPLDQLKCSIARFWDSYRIARKLAPAQYNTLLARSVYYLPARLIQSAFEWSNSNAQFSPHSILAVQFAENILLQPDAAAAQFLGLVISGHS